MNIFTHTKSQFATRLISAREAAGLNGGQVAKRLGKAGHTTISMWENDKALPALDDFVELCKLYNVTPNEILGFNKSNPQIADYNYMSE